MTITHILVDFENVQPPADDIALVRGDACRLVIFRGPGQTKYAADVAEAWQPLGPNVLFVRCAKAGRNAVDMHVAFYLGEFASRARAAGESARFVVVSRDTDFDPLLMHVRTLGFEATRTESVRVAMGSAAGNGRPAAPARAAAPGRAAKAAAKKAAVKESAPKESAPKESTPKESAAKAAKSPAAKTARKTAAKKTATKTAGKAAGRAAAAPAPAPAAPRPEAPPPAAKKTRTRKAAAQVAAPPPPAPPVPGVSPEARTKILDNLRRMGEKRPARRAALERHIESHLGRQMGPAELQALIADLERDGLLAFDDRKVIYRL